MDFEKINYIEISQSINSEAIQVSPDCNIIEITNTFGTNIHYHLKNEKKLPANTLNSFDILMQSATRSNKLYTPNFLYSAPNRKQLLRLDIANWIQHHKSGWSTQLSADNQGKQFVVALSEALWYIDIHDYNKLEERSCHIPYLFHEFLNRADPESYRETRKPFDTNKLNLHCHALAPFATSLWIKSSSFTWLFKEFEELILVISHYIDYLQKQQK